MVGPHSGQELVGYNIHALLLQAGVIFGAWACGDREGLLSCGASSSQKPYEGRNGEEDYLGASSGKQGN